MDKVDRDDRVVLLDDFNAKAGTKDEAWAQKQRPLINTERNDNGERLLSVCARFGLRVTNTCFKHKQYGTWQHMRFKTWHMIDVVLVRARDMRWVRDSKVMCDAECDTDHRLIVMRIGEGRYRPAQQREGSKAEGRPSRLQVKQIKDTTIERQLCDKIHDGMRKWCEEKERSSCNISQI